MRLFPSPNIKITKAKPRGKPYYLKTSVFLKKRVFTTHDYLGEGPQEAISALARLGYAGTTLEDLSHGYPVEIANKTHRLIAADKRISYSFKRVPKSRNVIIQRGYIMDWGAWHREMRSKRGVSQAALWKDMGVTGVPRLSSCEWGVTTLSKAQLEAFCKVLQIKVPEDYPLFVSKSGAHLKGRKATAQVPKVVATKTPKPRKAKEPAAVVALPQIEYTPVVQSIRTKAVQQAKSLFENPAYSETQVKLMLRLLNSVATELLMEA